MNRPVWVEIDLAAIAHNMREIRRVTYPGAQIMAVVKANGYGHGAVPVSRTVIANGADRLGVAILQEALELRAAGIQVPILILGYTPIDEVQAVVEAGVTQTVYRFQEAQALSQAAQRLGRTALVHVKIDTGMGRIGFLPTPEAVEDIMRLADLPGLRVEGIFTHFATADGKDKTYARQQLERFLWMVAELEARGLTIPLRHAANSAAIMELPEAHLDLVRPGICLYGLYPSEEVNKETLSLKPAMSLKGRIALVKEVPAGAAISYGCTYVTSQPARIASVPLGYADGYSRLLSNHAQALVRGKRVKQVGRVCMDQTMFDVTDLPQAQLGDEVVLFGRQGGEHLPVEELARILGTINYEMVCMVSPRVPRVYLNTAGNAGNIEEKGAIEKPLVHH